MPTLPYQFPFTWGGVEVDADTLTALAVYTGAMAALGALTYYLRNY